jgi:hypothetical protein
VPAKIPSDALVSMLYSATDDYERYVEAEAISEEYPSDEVNMVSVDMASEAPKSSTDLQSIEETQHTQLMEPISRPELDAKLEAIEARMDARLAGLAGTMDGFIGRLDERDKTSAERLINLGKQIDNASSGLEKAADRIESKYEESASNIRSLKTTIVITAVSSVLAIVLGVAAFNSTVLSNMVASFESGKNTADAIARAADQLRQAQELAAKSAPPSK